MKKTFESTQVTGALRFLTAKSAPYTWRILAIKQGFSEDGELFFSGNMLRASAPLFDNVPVNMYEFVGQHYNHLPEEVIRELPKGVSRNTTGWVDDPVVEDLSSYGLEGTGLTVDFHVTDSKMRERFANAWDMGNKKLYGFSIEGGAKTVPAIIEGRQVKDVPLLKYVQTLDVVSDPRAGGDMGQFLRIAASFNKGERTMNFWQRLIKALLGRTDQTDLAKAVRSNPALAGTDADGLKDKDDSAVVVFLTDHMAQNALTNIPTSLKIGSLSRRMFWHRSLRRRPPLKG